MLQPSQDKSKVLYDAVSKDYDIGSYDEFSAKLQNPEKRKAFYEGVGKEYALGTYEEFESKVAPLKKKDKSDFTATPQKSASETSIGSSGTVGSNGFPAIDQNLGVPGLKPDFKTVDQLANPPKSKQKIEKTPKKEDTSLFDYLKESLDNGIAIASKSIYDTPALLYDYAASITNPIFKSLTGYKGEDASSKKLAKDLGFVNIPSETLKAKIEESNKKIEAYNAENGGDALNALSNGNYSGAAKIIAGTTFQSLPIMIAAMASGGETMAMSAIGVSTASTKNAQLEEEQPDMKLGTRVRNSLTSGALEATLGHLFTGASGAVAKKILADKGVEAGSKIISNSFKKTVEKTIEKSPLVGLFGEFVEESAVEFGNQSNDIASGIRDGYDPRAILNAGISSTGLGGVNTVAVYGAKGLMAHEKYQKVKKINKEINSLSEQLENPNLSQENKNVLSSRISRLVTENKSILGAELQKLNSLPSEVKKELLTINKSQDELIEKAEDIKADSNIPLELKKTMLSELSLQSKNNEKRKSEILSEETVLDPNFNVDEFKGFDEDFNLETDEKPQEVAVAEQVIEAQPQAEIETQSIEVEPLPVRFEKSLTLLKDIESKQGVDARNAKRERAEFLKQNPTIKYIDDNYKNITKQLEEQGIFKQLKDC